MRLKRYRHRSGAYHRCLHCEVALIVVGHRWVGRVSHARRKAMILRDLRQVVRDVQTRYRP